MKFLKIFKKDWELDNDNLECYLFDELVKLNIIENITNNC